MKTFTLRNLRNLRSIGTIAFIAFAMVMFNNSAFSQCTGYVTFTTVDASSFNSNDGSSTVYPDSMTSPFMYLWDAPANNQTTQIASNLGPGVYCVTVTDANGCIATGCVIISANSGSGCWVVLSATDATCSTCADGSATAMPDSTFTGPFVYLWDDPSAQTTSVATGLLPGTYCVTMTDTAGCIATGCVVVGPTTPSSCSASFYPYVDSTQTNLVYLIENSTGNGLSYYWDFDDGSTSTQQFPTHVYTSYGTFNICLTISDNSNCIDTYCISMLLDSVQKTGSGAYTVIVVPDVPVTGIENSVSIDLKTVVYPNPASSEVYVELTGWSNSVTLTLLNVVGQKLSREVVSLDTGQNTVKLDMNDYSAGLYFIQVDSEKNREIKRISISE